MVVLVEWVLSVVVEGRASCTQVLPGDRSGWVLDVRLGHGHFLLHLLVECSFVDGD